MPTVPTQILMGYSSDGSWAFTQGLYDNGKLMPNTASAGSWTGAWVAMCAIRTTDGNTENQYVLGCGNSSKKLFIQRITTYGTLGAETYTKTFADYTWDSCVSYRQGGQAFVLLHDTSTKRYELYKAAHDGTMADWPVQSGTWGLGYQNLFTVTVDGTQYLGGNGSSENQFFLQVINNDGTLASGNSYTATWGSYYNTLIAFQSGSKAFIFGQSKSSKRWFTQEVTSGGKLASSEAASGTFTYFYPTATTWIDGGVTYLVAQTNDSSHRWFIQGFDGDGKLYAAELNSGNFGYFYRFLHVYSAPGWTDNGTWMTEMYSTLQNKTLKQIIMPGSHDAGMYTCQYFTTNFSRTGVFSTIAASFVDMGSAYFTQTQWVNIGQQLTAGSRFFDLRPVQYTMTGRPVAYYTGHFASVAGSYVGSCGGSLDLILKDVYNFATDPNVNRQHELIILKFSHYYTRVNDTVSGGWNAGQMSDFATYVTGKLKDIMVTWSGAGKIGSLTYSQIMAAGANSQHAKVLVLMDDLVETVRNPAAGLFRCSDYPYDSADPDFVSPHVDMTIYDDYSNTDSVATMQRGQKAELVDAANHKADMYVLSWTLTQQFNPIPTSSIFELSCEANDTLPDTMNAWYSDGTISKDKLPNVIYVDYLNSMQGGVVRDLLKKVYG